MSPTNHHAEMIRNEEIQAESDDPHLDAMTAALDVDLLDLSEASLRGIIKRRQASLDRARVALYAIEHEARRADHAKATWTVL